MKVIVGFTLTLPFVVSFLLALPLAFTVSVTGPAAPTVRARRPRRRRPCRWLTRFLPLSDRVPGPGTLTGIDTVPFFLLCFCVPRVKWFEGSDGAAGGGS